MRLNLAYPLLLSVVIISALDVFGFVQIYNFSFDTPLFSIHIIDLLFLGILIVGIIIPLLRRNFIKVRIVAPLLLLVGYDIFLILLSIGRGATLRNAIRLGAPILYLLIVVAVPSLIKTRKEILITLRLLWGLIQIGLAAVIFQSVTGYAPEFANEPGALSYVYQTTSGFYRSYNPSIILVIFGFCLSYAMALHKINLKICLALVLFVIAFVLSYSRITYLSTLVVLCIAPILLVINLKNTIIYRLSLIMIILIIISYSGLGQIFAQRFGSLFEDIQLNEGTFSERLAIIDMAYDMLSEQEQFLLGTGFAHISNVEGLEGEDWDRDTKIAMALNSGADLGWLSLVFRTGIIGLFFFLYFLFSVFKELYRKYYAEADSTMKPVRGAGLLFICYGCVYNFAGNFFLYPSFSIVVAVLLGLVEAVPGSPETSGAWRGAHKPCLKLTTAGG